MGNPPTYRHSSLVLVFVLAALPVAATACAIICAPAAHASTGDVAAPACHAPSEEAEGWLVPASVHGCGSHDVATRAAPALSAGRADTALVPVSLPARGVAPSLPAAAAALGHSRSAIPLQPPLRTPPLSVLRI